MLNKVSEQDLPLFTPEVLHTQRRLFHRTKNLKLALLYAYTYVGGPTELILANAIIKRKNDPELRATAERCAEGIQARLSTAQVTDLLLRTTVESMDDMLLRPTKLENADEKVPLSDTQTSAGPPKATIATYRAEENRQEECRRI